MVPELLLVERRVALLLEGLHRVEDAGLKARGRVVGEPEVDGDTVGRLEADPLDLAGDPVGLMGQDRLRLGAVLLHQLDALARADAVGLKEDVELPLRPLAVPGLLDGCRPLSADPRDVPKAPRLLAEDAEGVGPEGI